MWNAKLRGSRLSNLHRPPMTSLLSSLTSSALFLHGRRLMHAGRRGRLRCPSSHVNACNEGLLHAPLPASAMPRGAARTALRACGHFTGAGRTLTATPCSSSRGHETATERHAHDHHEARSRSDDHEPHGHRRHAEGTEEAYDGPRSDPATHRGEGHQHHHAGGEGVGTLKREAAAAAQQLQVVGAVGSRRADSRVFQLSSGLPCIL